MDSLVKWFSLDSMPWRRYGVTRLPQKARSSIYRGTPVDKVRSHSETLLYQHVAIYRKYGVTLVNFCQCMISLGCRACSKNSLYFRASSRLWLLPSWDPNSRTRRCHPQPSYQLSAYGTPLGVHWHWCCWFSPAVWWQIHWDSTTSTICYQRVSITHSTFTTNGPSLVNDTSKPRTSLSDHNSILEDRFFWSLVSCEFEVHLRPVEKTDPT